MTQASVGADRAEVIRARTRGATLTGASPREGSAVACESTSRGAAVASASPKPGAAVAQRITVYNASSRCQRISEAESCRCQRITLIGSSRCQRITGRGRSRCRRINHGDFTGSPRPRDTNPVASCCRSSSSLCACRRRAAPSAFSFLFFSSLSYFDCLAHLNASQTPKLVYCLYGLLTWLMREAVA